MPRLRRLAAAGAAVVLAAGAGDGLRAAAQPPPDQHGHPPGPAATPAPAGTPVAVPAPAAPPPGAPAPRRISEAELHRHGGIPRGWKFGVPPGDAARGRELYRDLECYKCHEIKTEKFPAPPDGKYSGPELTGMGRIHPAEYIAESILAPNAVIVDEPGHTGPDGRSLMPSYVDTLTLTQWVDLVAFLKGLTEGGDHPEGHVVERTATVGDYRIRLVYAEGGHGGAHAGHGPMARVSRPGGHLMAFITERDTGEPIHYLPVTVTFRGRGADRRSVVLQPMLTDGGFHYGADIVLTSRVRVLMLSVGPTTMKTTGVARGRFAKSETVVFDWGQRAK
jgi:hypothetical protein